MTLEVIQKIMEKEVSKSKILKSSNLDKNLEIHPLKGLVTCAFCSRKLSCYASHGNGGNYFYYTCGNKYCPQRINIPKDVMEKQFEAFIDKMKISKKLMIVLKSQMEKWKNGKAKNQLDSIPHIQ